VTRDTETSPKKGERRKRTYTCEIGEEKEKRFCLSKQKKKEVVGKKRARTSAQTGMVARQYNHAKGMQMVY